jgi:HK97 family phage major capsid protein
VKVGDQLRSRAATIEADIGALQQKIEESDGPGDEQDHERLDALLDDHDAVLEELKPIEAREARVESLRTTASRSSNLDTPEVIIKPERRDPFADLDAVRQHQLPVNELRSRASYAVEAFSQRQDHWGLDDDGAENVMTLLHKRGAKFGKPFAEQLLITGAPEYLAAFEQYLTDPGGFSQRAALSLTPANGGYLVPFTLDPTIILTNAGSANPYRQIATVKTTTTNDWNGVTSAGVSAEWTAEGIEAADASPTVGQLKITPQKADAYLFGSYEVLGDSDFAEQLPELLADAKDRIEETAFAVGTGSGQPFGIITRGTVLAAVAGTAATGPTAADVYALSAALPARWRGPRARPVWISHLNTINRLRNVPAFTGATTSILNDTTDPPQLLGKPVLESTSVVGAFANGNKVLAFLDGRQFYIVDRVGMSVLYDPLVLGANRRPTGQGAWYAFWRTGADVSAATAVRVLSLTT